MRKCPSCETSNMEGVFFCEECGQPLFGDSFTVATRSLEMSTSSLITNKSWGTAHLEKVSQVVMHIHEAKNPYILPDQPEITLGRYDGTSPKAPTIDLTPFGALEKGVSRMHAMIQRADNTILLTDLGSANGTHLNGQKLNANQPRIVRDGDEIRFGKLVCYIYFK
jgi:hypothetical protein